MRAWFSGRTPACQVGDGISIIPARTNNNLGHFCVSFDYVLKVDKPVHTGDKGHWTFWEVREIVRE